MQSMSPKILIDRLRRLVRHWELRAHGWRVLTVLAVMAPRDAVFRAAAWLRGGRWPWRLVGSTAIALAIIVPAGLYRSEHARSAELLRAYRDLSFSSGMEMATLRGSMGSLLAEQMRIKHDLLDAGYAVESDDELAIPVIVTGYSSTVRETDSTPFVTASNTPTRTGIVALSRDLLQRYTPGAPFGFGDVVHLSGLGDFVVEDSMHPRWHRRVDVWFPSSEAALRFGRRRTVLRGSAESQRFGNTVSSSGTFGSGLASNDGASP